jgi:hypothetical protein
MALFEIGQGFQLAGCHVTRQWHIAQGRAVFLPGGENPLEKFAQDRAFWVAAKVGWENPPGEGRKGVSVFSRGIGNEAA